MLMAGKTPSCEQFRLAGQVVTPIGRVSPSSPGIETVFLGCAVRRIVNMGNIAQVIAQQVIISCCTALGNRNYRRMVSISAQISVFFRNGSGSFLHITAAGIPTRQDVCAALRNIHFGPLESPLQFRQRGMVLFQLFKERDLK